MPASQRHLAHLSDSLDESDDPVQRPPVSELTLEERFNTIALKRIRSRRSDWQGLRVDAMLWHLPDLKPAVRAALSQYVAGSWHAFMQTSTDTPGPDSRQTNPTHRLPIAERSMDAWMPEPAVPVQTATATEPEGIFTINPAPRRDWFDRFTDWVAALLTLWK